jgi:phosphoenolpyruvate carboxykinase (ATP)
MPIGATRTLLRAAIDGSLDGAEYRRDDVFAFEVPVAVPGVDPALLEPRATWRDPAAYDRGARELARMFRENAASFAAAGDAVLRAGPLAPSTSGQSQSA